MSSPDQRSKPRALGAALLGPLLHRDSPEPPRGLSRVAVRMNQGLFERAVTPPWVDSRVECQRYWESPAHGGNQPIEYATKPVAVVDFLDSFWEPEVTTASSVLEVGCNAGANLNRLQELGFSDLRAVEINAAAIVEMKRQFPALADVSVTVGAFEEVLPTLPSDSVDVVFAMAVLMHVHPTSRDVFREMVRISRGYVCTVEAEVATTPQIFARNYRRVFSGLGCSQLRSTTITPEMYPDLSPHYDGYVARLFAIP